ncbi:MAG: phosphoenolpyruvate--protein phosphotransferase [Clostridia bacterium]|nr:phosphoenolpyruvate--protein phosphotransferase [Clostridia bacterium]
MIKLHGKGVCSAIAIGQAKIVGSKMPIAQKRQITDTQGEILRFNEAKKRAGAQLSEIYKRALREVGETSAQIFEIHQMMLEDEDYNESVLSIINEGINAEYAVFKTCESFSELLSSMDDSYMRARALDIKDISNRLISCLKNEDSGEGVAEKCIICAYDLSPSETVLLDKDKVLAFVLSQGSASSHTAILARNMGIAAVVGVGDELLARISEGDMLCVDGYTGDIIISPDESTLDEMKRRKAQDERKKELLKSLSGKETITLDGTKINLYANIGAVSHVGEAIFNDAEGIGLFRSEFLYLEGNDYPSERAQFLAYKKVLESMNGKRVIIRTLDIGADKQAPYFCLPKEENPALGLRAIRICLTRPEVFKTQLRALYRASAFGRLGIMFPMIVSVDEVLKIKDLCAEVMTELESEGIEFSREVELGIMIETPASAIISDLLAPCVDFFSVGTNDLTQYTLACDRQSTTLDEFCDTHHEAILRLIALSAENAHKHGAWIGICGELASDLSLTETFLRMGIDELSVSPAYILSVRDAVRKIDLTK